jgi:ABC-2 type transport system permease protein
MSALTIALKDIRVLLKDRGSVIMLFLVPLLFVLVYSGALSAIGGSDEEEDTRIPLPVVNLDGGEAAQSLVDGITQAGGVRVEDYDQAEAEALLDEGDLARVLFIPEDFSADLAEGRVTRLRLVSQSDADPEQTEAVRLVVDGVARDLTLVNQVYASLARMGAMMAASPGAVQPITAEQMEAQARSQIETASEPLVSVEQTIPMLGRESHEINIEDVGALAVPGFAVMFAFLTAQTTARSIHDEKKAGSFRRLIASPTSKASMLAGKLLPNLIVTAVQLAVIFAFGIFGLRAMGLPAASLGSDPLATVIVLALVALCSSAMGILIASLARTENQISGLGTLLLWVGAIVGGSIIPPFILSRFLGPLPAIMPHYWANRAMESLTLRGATLADVSIDILALLGFSALFFIIGLWRFDFD